MPITFNCPCGKTLRVPDENAGRRAKCPACNAVVNVPKPEPEPEFEIVEEQPTGATAPPEVKAYGKPVEDDDSYDGTTYSLAPESRDEDDEGDGKKSSSRGKSGLPNFRKGTDNHS